MHATPILSIKRKIDLPLYFPLIYTPPRSSVCLTVGVIMSISWSMERDVLNNFYGFELKDVTDRWCGGVQNNTDSNWYLQIESLYTIIYITPGTTQPTHMVNISVERIYLSCLGGVFCLCLIRRYRVQILYDNHIKCYHLLLLINYVISVYNKQWAKELSLCHKLISSNP